MTAREGGTTSERVMIFGRVQGVGFRDWVQRRAVSAGLAGWVRNRAGGSVEAVLAGERQAVQAMIAACADGPSSARVARVDLLGAADPVSGDFEVRPTV